MENVTAFDVQGMERVADPAEQLRQAEALEHGGQLDEAVAVLQDLTTRHPEDEQAWRDLARLLVLLQRDGEAEQVLKEAQQHHAGVPSFFAQYAQYAEKRNDWNSAEERWTEVRTRFPGRADGWMGGMRSLRELGDIDAADHLISQAVRLFPADQAIAFAWAEIPRLRDDVSARLERWAEVRTQHPHSPGGFTAGAFALFDAGQVSEAETVAREGCALFPHDRDVQRALGIILIKANKAEAADEPLERALALDPSDATALYYYAQAAFRRGSMETAIQRAEDAEARFPDDIRIKDLIRSARLPEPAATDSELSQKEEAAAVPPPPWEAPGFHYEAHQEAVQPDLVFQKPPQPNKRPSLLSRLFGQGRR